MFKIDLHTHSIISKDGSLSEADYINIINNGVLDFIAVTDHNDLSFALSLKEKLGGHIIVGEEISSREGDVIGLFLKELITPGMTLEQTVKLIRDQGGLVYIPHPFETVRKGISLENMNKIIADIDIVEVHNGRAKFQNHGPEALKWSNNNHKAGAASSDAHGISGWGKTYSIISNTPDVSNLADMLSKGDYKMGTVGMRGIMYPKLNRIRRRFRRA